MELNEDISFHNAVLEASKNFRSSVGKKYSVEGNLNIGDAVLLRVDVYRYE